MKDVSHVDMFLIAEKHMLQSMKSYAGDEHEYDSFSTWMGAQAWASKVTRAPFPPLRNHRCIHVTLIRAQILLHADAHRFEKSGQAAMSMPSGPSLAFFQSATLCST
jgi:hypothetical protein